MVNALARREQDFEPGGRGFWVDAFGERRDAEAAEEIARLRQLIRVIGHEVSNSLAPMASLMASARVMLETQAGRSPRLHGIVETVGERAVHLQSFIDDCLLLTRLPEPRPAPVDWSRVLARLRLLCPELTVESPPPRAGFFDAVQIEQVLINLLKNAREAGGTSSEVRLRFEAAPGGGTRVAVLDRGAGMTDVQIAALARRGFTTKPAGGGIGLTLCRAIVERHRSRLTIERRRDGGTKVSFCLPDA
ncbi:MAG TPA: HAMP domain-containing sensor histidine kinase [Polyangia bacterium]|jgi:signal transduction histidine kinase